MALLPVVVDDRGDVGHKVAAGREQADLVVESEGAHVHVRGPHDPVLAVDDEALRVEDRGLRVEVDAHPRLEEGLVVRGLGAADDVLVGLLADVELDVDAAVRRGVDRGEQGFVGDEVGADDRELLLSEVEERVEDLEVRLRREPGPRWDELHSADVSPDVRLRRSALVVADAQLLTAFGVPVGGEDRFDRGDDLAADLDHDVVPMPPDLDVGLHVVGRVDHVLRAHHRPLPVDDEEFAVIAQIDPPQLAPPRDEREHEVPFDPGRGQPLAERMESRVLPRPDVVVEDPDVDAPGRCTLEGFEEHVGRLVPRHDVDLHMNVLLRPVDELGHPLDRRIVVHRDAVVGAGDHRQRGEVATEFGDEVEVARGLQRRGHIGQVVGALVHELVRHRLDPGAPPVDVGAADEEEERDADDGQEEDEQQPRRGR